MERLRRPRPQWLNPMVIRTYGRNSIRNAISSLRGRGTTPIIIPLIVMKKHVFLFGILAGLANAESLSYSGCKLQNQMRHRKAVAEHL
ncbi:MAG: hypothetical protein ACI4O9_04000, partial [Akkermansia sp.]